MYVKMIQVDSYKSYSQTSALSLQPGINIVTGPNNVGKTALLEAISLTMADNSHRTIQTLPEPGMQVRRRPQVLITLKVSSKELRDHVLTPGVSFGLLLPTHGTRLQGRTEFDFPSNDSMFCLRFAQWVLSHDELEFTVSSGFQGRLGRTPTFLIYSVQTTNDDNKNVVVGRFRVTETGDLRHETTVAPNRLDDELGDLALAHYRRRRYMFRAERFNVGASAFGDRSALSPDASNLPEVLSNLQSNPRRFQRYNETVARVLPGIQQVTVKNLSDSKLQILIWPHSPTSEREDLAVSLSESGTGVGQVLAMLYVVLTADHPLTVIIDEPQSFLHPGAIRKLIEVLRENPRHQYIITTHSPTVISAANPSTITLIKQRDGVSDFQGIDPYQHEHLREYLLELGARLSDAFGADNVLWVEGPTEEICFPIILEKVAHQPLLGTVILAVKHTGDLEGRHARTVFEIYDRLSSAGGLLPPAIGFLFDREGRSESEIEDIKARSRNLVMFTERRLYENYILNPRAIAATINSIAGFRPEPVTPEEIDAWILREVDAWLAGRRADRKYGPAPNASDTSSWTRSIHGANFLKHLFGELSENRVVYDKIQYSVAITRWIAENEPEAMQEFVEQLLSALGRRVRG